MPSGPVGVKESQPTAIYCLHERTALYRLCRLEKCYLSLSLLSCCGHTHSRVVDELVVVEPSSSSSRYIDSTVSFSLRLLVVGALARTAVQCSQEQQQLGEE